MKESLVSMILPVYNREATIARAIESVLAQSHRPLELIDLVGPVVGFVGSIRDAIDVDLLAHDWSQQMARMSELLETMLAAPPGRSAAQSR